MELLPSMQTETKKCPSLAGLPSAPNSRVIKTVTGGVLKDFTSANLTAADLGVGSDAQRDSLISFIRSLQLGDIFHSNSVIVGSPRIPLWTRGSTAPGIFMKPTRTGAKSSLSGPTTGCFMPSMPIPAQRYGPLSLTRY